MESTGRKILYQGGTGEIVEKKSRFIATVAKADSQEEALDFVAAMKKKYWDARHNCYAFAVGDQHQLQRCSDDGEPSGTAGRPMLDVILGEDVHNIVVVVTRYFGGVLLGTGGLVRAYQQATQEGLRNSVILSRQTGTKLSVGVDYNQVGRVQYLLGNRQIPILESVYSDTVEFQVVAAQEQLEELEKELTEGTNGTAQLTALEQVEFALVQGEIKIF